MLHRGGGSCQSRSEVGSTSTSVTRSRTGRRSSRRRRRTARRTSLYIVLDDVGFSAMSCYGGPIETPNIDRIAARGRALHAVAHDGAVLADPVVPADRPQPHPQQHGLHHRGGDRVPERERHDPAGERDALGDPRRARLEHLHGRQVAPVPDRRDEPRGDRGATGRPAAASSAGTGSSARRRTSGIPTSSTTTTWSTSRARPRRATTSPTTSPTRRSSSSRTRRRSRRRSRSSSTTRRAPATRRTTRRRSGSTSSRASSTWATRRCASRRWPGRRSSGIVPADTELPPLNPIGTPETRTGPDGQAVPGARLHPPVGLAERRREAAVRPDGRGVRRLPRPRRPPHRPAARLPGADRAAGEHAWSSSCPTTARAARAARTARSTR